MKNGIRVIDCEHHFSLDLMVKEWKKTMTPEQWKATGGDVRFDNPVGLFKEIYDAVADIDALRLDVMDKAGIDYAHVSLTTPGAEYFEPESERRLRLYITTP